MNNNQQQQLQQNMQTGSGSGLTRYRSAPSSYFATLLNSPPNDAVFEGDDFEHLFNPRASSPEAPGVFSRFTSNRTETARENSPTTPMPSSQSQLNPQLLPPRKAEPRQQSNDYSSASRMMYQTRTSEASNSTPSMGNSYGGLPGSGSGSFNPNQLKMERVDVVANSSLVRHSSSPAGLFANMDIENEFGTMRAMGEPSSSSAASRFKNQMNFSSRHSSSSRMMNPIPEFDIKGENNTANRHFDENRSNDVDYITGLPLNTWDESDDFFKGLADDDSKRFSSDNASDDQSKEGVNRPPARLSHHLSLPTSSSELSAMDKLLQDSVPCKIRAKRGFATHPRSIAERVRRTKISERIRKLQELVPNMDKQTNTSDMLDLAVDYIKDLQRQVKTLSDNRAKCSCSGKQNS